MIFGPSMSYITVVGTINYLLIIYLIYKVKFLKILGYLRLLTRKHVVVKTLTRVRNS